MRIILPGLDPLEHDQIVAQDARVGVGGQAFLHFQLQVGFRARHPKDASLSERPEVRKMHLRPVEDRDFPLAQAGAQFRGAHAVVLAGGIHDGEARQEVE